MAPRRRVSLRESFKIAGRAAMRADDPSGGMGSFFGTILFGVWWWIRGVPQSDEKGPSSRDEETR